MNFSMLQGSHLQDRGVQTVSLQVSVASAAIRMSNGKFDFSVAGLGVGIKQVIFLSLFWILDLIKLKSVTLASRNGLESSSIFVCEMRTMNFFGIWYPFELSES